MNVRLIYFIILLAAINGCKVNKNTASKNAGKKNIDTSIVVNGKRFHINTGDNDKSGKDVATYQPSAKRVNDIIHTILDIHFNYEKQQVVGKATITIKPYFYPTSTLELDAKYFDLNRVAMITKKDTQNLKFSYDSSKIHIELGKVFQRTDTFKIFIDYVAKPNENIQKGSAAIKDAKGIYFINPKRTDPEKPREIWTQGETQSNSGWFPTNDVPDEKMTTEIYITAGEKDVTLSNGEMIYSKINADSTHTDYWKQNLPHAPYLVMMAVGEFDIVKDSWRDSVEVNYYVEHAYKPYAKLIFGHTPEMLEFFSKRLGVDYPWDKFSQVVVRDFVSGAMENTSAVVHFEGLNHDSREHLDNSYESIISHELFHQWFGDLVTCESWSNVPLNESFATYGQYLWDEHKYGKMEADFNFEENQNAYLGQKVKQKSILIRYHYSNREDMFDVVSYQKGACILHMLRNVVGDDAFFKSLQLYLEKNKFKAVEIHNLRLAFEEVTGEDMNWFFNQWFLGKGHPVLKIEYVYNANRDGVKLLVEQKQDSSFGLFKLPVAVDIYTNGKIDHKKIVIENRIDSFFFQSYFPIELVNFDADKILLAQINEKKTIEENYFMLAHAPLFGDKEKAAKGITSANIDTLNPNINAAINYSLNHEFYGVKELGMMMLQKLRANERIKFSDKIIQLLKQDEHSKLRSTALEFLFELDSLKYKNEIINAVNDSSYNVAGLALHFLSEIDPILALKLAEQNKNSKSGMMQAVYANLVGNHAKGDFISYFESTFGKFGYYKFSILNSYGDYLKRSDNEIILKAIPGLKEYFNKIKSSDIYARMMVKRIEGKMSTTFIEMKNSAIDQKKSLKPENPKQKELDEIISRADSMLEKIEGISLLEH